MFYLCRLLIYNREANDCEPREKEILQRQYSIMIRRLLYSITWPSAVLTFIFGLSLLWHYPSIPVWLWIKLSIVILLFGYHYSLHYLSRQQIDGKFFHSSNTLRMWNEVPTVMLVSIVMLVVVKNGISLLYGLIGIITFIILLIVIIKIYKAFREKT